MVDQIQAFTFLIKHKKGISNKVVDALNKTILVFQEVKLQSVGLEKIKDLYKEDFDLKEAYKTCMEYANTFHGEFIDYVLQDGLLFKGSRLCIPKSSMREKIIKEKCNGALGEHFGAKKKLEQVARFYY